MAPVTARSVAMPAPVAAGIEQHAAIHVGAECRLYRVLAGLGALAGIDIPGGRPHADITAAERMDCGLAHQQIARGHRIDIARLLGLEAGALNNKGCRLVDTQIDGSRGGQKLDIAAIQGRHPGRGHPDVATARRAGGRSREQGIDRCEALCVVVEIARIGMRGMIRGGAQFGVKHLTDQLANASEPSRRRSRILRSS